jgi:hypothetical protein
MADHDQFFKKLFHLFLGEFVGLFFPDWASKLDFSHPEWLDQELFPDPPDGERRVLDLVAQVTARETVPEPRTGEPGWLVLIHIEIESADGVAQFRPRMCGYYHGLRGRRRLPVLPIGLYLHVGLDGVGWDTYEESLWGRTLLRFEYPYVGLPALDGLAYLNGPSLLGVALAVLMRLPKERRAELKLEAMLRLNRSGGRGERSYMLELCVDRYFPLNDAEKAEYAALKQSERGREVREMEIGWLEQGIQEGLQQGVVRGRLELVRRQLEKRFGPLSAAARQKLESLTAEQLDDIGLAVLDATSLDELGFTHE